MMPSIFYILSLSLARDNTEAKFCYRPNNEDPCPDGYKEIESTMDIFNSVEDNLYIHFVPISELHDFYNFTFDRMIQNLFITGNHDYDLYLSVEVNSVMSLSNVSYYFEDTTVKNILQLKQCKCVSAPNNKIAAFTLYSDVESIKNQRIDASEVIIEGKLVEGTDLIISTSSFSLSIEGNCKLEINDHIEISSPSSSIKIQFTKEANSTVQITNSNVELDAVSYISDSFLLVTFCNCSVSFFQTGAIKMTILSLIDSILDIRKGIDRNIHISSNNSILKIGKYLSINQMTISATVSFDTVDKSIVTIDNLITLSKKITLKSNHQTDVSFQYFNDHIEYINGENIIIRDIPYIYCGTRIDLPIYTDVLNLNLFVDDITKTINLGKVKCKKMMLFFIQLTKENITYFDSLLSEDIEIINSNELEIDNNNIEMHSQGLGSWLYANYEVWTIGNSIYFKLLTNPVYRNINACKGCSIDIFNPNWYSVISNYTESVEISLYDINGTFFTFPPSSPKKVPYSIIGYNVIIDPSNINISVSKLTLEVSAIFTKPYLFNLDELVIQRATKFQPGSVLDDNGILIVNIAAHDSLQSISYKKVSLTSADDTTIYFQKNKNGDAVAMFRGYDFEVPINDLRFITSGAKYLVYNIHYPEGETGARFISDKYDGNVIFYDFTEKQQLKINIKNIITLESNGFCPALLDMDDQTDHEIRIDNSTFHPFILKGSFVRITSINSSNLRLVSLLEVEIFLTSNTKIERLEIDGNRTRAHNIDAKFIVARAKEVEFVDSFLAGTSLEIEVTKDLVPMIIVDCDDLFDQVVVSINEESNEGFFLLMELKGESRKYSTRMKIIYQRKVGFKTTEIKILNGSCVYLEIQSNLKPHRTPDNAKIDKSISTKTITILVSTPLLLAFLLSIYCIFLKAKKLSPWIDENSQSLTDLIH